MECPLCQVALRIKSSLSTVENGKAVTVQDLICINKKCEYGKRNAVVKRIRHVAPEAHADERYKFCCDGLLAFIGDETYYPAPNVQYSESDTTLTVPCPTCGTVHRFDITGKTRES